MEIGATDTSFYDVLENNGTTAIQTQYSVEVSSVAGCAPKSNQSVVFDVLPSLNAVIQGPDHICEGTEDSLTVVVLNSEMESRLTNAQYRWFVDGIEKTTETTHRLLTNDLSGATSPHNISVVIKLPGVAGCNSWGEAEFNIQVDATPVVRLMASDTMICRGGDVDLSLIVTSTNDVPAVAYKWINVTNNDTL